MPAVIALVVGWLVAVTPAASADGPTTFSNSTSIAIPATGSTDQMGPASPYPSTIAVSGLSGSVTKVTVTFGGLTHSTVNDIDAMVVAPSGENLIVMSDVGDPSTLAFANDVNLTFDDAAAGPVPTGNIPSGSYRPTNNVNADGTSTDTFPTPAPTPSNETTLAGAFTGIDPNGTWRLYVVDDGSGDTGTMTDGWSLTVTTETAAVATTTTVATSHTPSTTGDPVTFTATVRAGGTPVTSGSVRFVDGTTSLGAPVDLGGSGTASITTSDLTEGTHEIRATYSGATGFLTSNGTVSQRVDNATVADGDTFCNTGPITVPSVGAAQPYPSHITVSGQAGTVTKVTATLKGLSHQAPIDLDVMLSGPDPSRNLLLLSDTGGQNPVSDLTVGFDDDAAGAVPVPLTSGTFRPTDDDEDGGSDTFPAPAPASSGATTLSTFDGSSADGQWSLWVNDDATGDSGSIADGWCLTVTSQVATQTTVTADPNPSTSGSSVTFTATVNAGSDPVTSGTVQFRDGAADLGTPVAVGADGTATFTTSDLTVGSHAITAAYGGFGTFAASSGSVTQVVEKTATTTTLTSTLNPSTVGQPVTFTADVTAGGDPVTTGTVTFSVDGVDGAPTALGGDGTATLLVPTFDAGTHTAVAHYDGSATLATSDDSLDQVVDLVDTATTLTTDPNPSTVGQSVTLTATVTAGGDPVTSGTVEFFDGATSLGSAPVVSGSASFTTTSPLAVGSHTLTARYSGTSTYAESSGGAEQVVEGLATVTTLTSSDNPSAAGDPVDITATVTAGGSPVDAGTVVFTVDGVDRPPVTVASDGTATTTLAAPTPGMHSVLAAYSGTDIYLSSEDSLDQGVAPEANAGGAYAVAEGGTLSLDASGSTTGATVAWDLNDDGDFTDATGVSPTVTWDQLEALGIDDGPSTRTVRARITLGSLTSTATTSLTVTNTPPTATVTGDLMATAGQPFTVKVGAEDPSSADLAASFTYTVDWGDGSPVETVTGPADPPVTHTYATAGDYSASFVAQDKDGGTGEPTSVTVTAAAATTTSTSSTTSTSTSSSTTSSTGTSSTGPTSTTEPSLPSSTSSGSGGSLAFTGTDTLGPLLVAAVFVLAGALALGLARRRRGSTGRHD
ncbi:exported hypothetical protein [Nostocoides japonicum T1-X7]|uniref:PKD domain-containing protein n=1 Tax=Nostocoides japonicum T1-X7 TaxID=1194083 RepID=A0A077LY22_9MICO|nr:Ig-like domain repeat protein [Tetrasphaera japonica]CCH78798.1 exported hypothetical protein [Tetrasphaera japonica T1-X7]